MYTEDGYIIRKCLNGEMAAYGLLVDKYKSSVYALAYTKLRNLHDAEDITQEVFLKAYQKLSTLKRWDNCLAWLFSITVNSCKDFLKSRARRPDGTYIEDQDTTLWDAPSIDAYRSESAAEAIREAIDELPEIYRQTLTLYYLGGLNSTEIARFLGTSANTVNQRLMRARTKLKEEMIAMMNTTFAEKQLHSGFTFRIIEAIKSTKIQPVSTKPLLPFISSATVGIVLTIMLFSKFFFTVAPHGDMTSAPLPSETQITALGEIPIELIVDAVKPPTVFGAHGTGVIGNSPEQPSQINAANVETSNTEIPAPYKLDNGLTIILRPVPVANEVALVVLYNLGDDHDPVGKSGRAHLLAHLYFTAAAGDTPARDVMQLQKRYVAGWNAQSGPDYTAFAGIVESAQFAAELKAAAVRMHDLRITEADLNREMPRMLVKLKYMYEGVPSLAGLNHVRMQLQSRPQGGRFGGAPEHIETMTLDELRQFWKDYYKPNNAVLAIAGGFDVAEARRLIHQNFSQIPPGKLPPMTPPKSEAKTRLIRRVAVKPAISNATGTAAIGYTAPPLRSKEYAPFLIAVSRLWANTQSYFQPGKTPPVYYTPLDDGTIIGLQADLRDDKDTTSALNELDQYLQAALTSKLTPEDKRRTLNSMALLGTVDMQEAMWLQNLYGLAFSVGRRYQLELDGNELRAAIQSVTDADMQHLATSIFAPEKRETVIVELENQVLQPQESEPKPPDSVPLKEVPALQSQEPAQDDSGDALLKEIFPEFERLRREIQESMNELKEKEITPENYAKFEAKAKELEAELQGYGRRIAEEFPQAVTFITFQGEEWVYDIDFQVLQDSSNQPVPPELANYFRYARLREMFGLPDIPPEQLQQMQKNN